MSQHASRITLLCTGERRRREAGRQRVGTFSSALCCSSAPPGSRQMSHASGYRFFSPMRANASRYMPERDVSILCCLPPCCAMLTPHHRSAFSLRTAAANVRN